MKIGTRGSPLALTQAHETARRLAAAHGDRGEPTEIIVVKTTGDAIQDRPLSEAGGKGLFTKELDSALIRGDIDIAVHSAKDLPTLLPPEIAILGYLPREDVRDAWIGRSAPHPSRLPSGATVGTASLRRAAMLKRLRPDIAITLLRGNVGTRLAKVAAGEIEGTLLALAGLKRLGLEGKVTALLEVDEFLPAPGQGAIAITGRRADAAILAYVAPILDAATGVALEAERAFLRVLDGSCRTPIGAHAQVAGGELTLRGMILRPDGSEVFEAQARGPQAAAAALGESAGRDILARAPANILQV